MNNHIEHADSSPGVSAAGVPCGDADAGHALVIRNLRAVLCDLAALNERIPLGSSRR